MAASEDVVRISQLERELQEMRERERLRQKYGYNLDEEQIKFYKEQEERAARKAAERARMEEEGKREAQRREEERKKFALELFESGHLTVNVDGVRLTRLNNEDASFPCPHCGAPVGAELILALAGVWKDAPNWHHLVIPRGIQAHNYVVYHGFPFVYEPMWKCPACKNGAAVTVQLVL